MRERGRERREKEGREGGKEGDREEGRREMKETLTHSKLKLEPHNIFILLHNSLPWSWGIYSGKGNIISLFSLSSQSDMKCSIATLVSTPPPYCCWKRRHLVTMWYTTYLEVLDFSILDCLLQIKLSIVQSLS